jgi:hypothetical protein
MRVASHLLVAAAAAMIACTAAQAGNLLLNAGFDTPNAGLSPPSYATGLSAVSPPGVSSSAASWNIWNNSLATTRTELLPSTDPAGGGFMAHVLSTGPEDGLYQFVAPDSVDFVSVDVFVLSGAFELGLARDGTYEATAKTSTRNEWIHLTASLPTTIGDEIFLYSTAGAGADFYVENAYAGTVPEASTWAMMLIGLGGLGLARRRGFGLRRA